MKCPPKIVTVVAAVIWQDGKYLGVKRPEGKPMAGQYEFPGGKVEPNESVRAALVRELREELDITPTAIAFFQEKEHAYDHISVRLHFFHIQAFEGEIHPLEGQELEWLTPREGQDRPFLEADREIVAQLAVSGGAVIQ
ncbi:(deoxy)nucleoside triphosphate pyrophosphohydrolase [Solidesulfovibrio sp.]|uniref:(deoxy)nucleoside triphosphate pyrophosphohydrolase n=1 Tax=Solidesulfovibrio sp. TaxID=2910990 RepID=UPI0026065E8B|nr:(deoxy)nucleoside triphosphate pyrophosphohydrolase [Solidesulfovibrio sp.]